jgi:osmotically-inducible protein OsmY
MSSTTRVAPTVAGAIAAGAAGAYFLDPDNGKRRRHIARDRALALIRKPARTAVREAERRASYAQGVVKGAVHDATTYGGDRDASRLNDPALAAKVESEVFRDPDSPKGAVSINVEGGVVYLRGELGSREDIEGLVAATKQVDGVGEVRSMLHLPGEEPPGKEVAGNGAGS